MAGLSQELEFILKVRDEATAALRAAGVSLDHLGDEAAEAGRKTDAFNKQTSAMELNARKLRSTLAALGVTAAATFAAKQGLAQATEYSRTLGMMQTLAGETAESVGYINSELLKMGPAVGRGPQDLAKSFQFIASSGYSGAAAMDILQASAKGAAIGLGTTKDVSDVVTSAMNTYGAENLKAADAVGILIAAIKAGKAEPDEFGKSMGRVLGIAKAAGVTFQDLSATIAVLSQTGLPAAEGVSAVRQVIQEMTSQTPVGVAVLDKYGLSLDILRQTIKEKGLLAAMHQLKDAIPQEELYKVLSGVEGRNALLTITQRAEEADKVFKAVASGGAKDLADAFKTVAASSAFQMDQGLALLQAALIQLGQKIMPPVLAGIGVMLDIFAQLQDTTSPLREGLRTLGAVLLGIGTTAALIVAPALITALVPAVVAATTAAALFTATLLANPFTYIALAIGVLVTAIVGFGNSSQTVNGKVVSGWSVMRATFAGTVASISTMLKELGGYFKDTFSSIVNGVILSGGAIKKFFSGDMDGAIAAAKSAFSSFADVNLPDVAAMGAKAAGAYADAYNKTIAGAKDRKAKAPKPAGMQAGAGNEGPSDEEPPQVPNSPGTGKKSAADKLADQSAERARDLAVELALEKQLAAVGFENGRQRAIDIAAYTAEAEARKRNVAVTQEQIAAEQDVARQKAGAKYDTDMLQRVKQEEWELDVAKRQGPAFMDAARLRGEAAEIQMAYLNAETEALRRGETAEQAKAAASRAAAAATIKARQDTYADQVRALQDVEAEIDLVRELSPLREMDARSAAIQEARIRALNEAKRSGIPVTDEYLDAIQRLAAADFDAAAAPESARAGFMRWMNDMQRNAVSTGSIIYESLNGAFNMLGTAMDRMLSGQKVGWQELIADFARNIAKMTAQMLAWAGFIWALRAMGVPIPPWMGVSGSSAPGAPPTQMSGSGVIKNAKGNAFDDGIVSEAMMFRSGNQLGVLGEGSKAEGILPLTRTPNGELGVSAVGSGGGGTTIVEMGGIHVTFQGSGDRKTDDESIKQLSDNLVGIIDERVAVGLQRANRPGGIQSRPF